MLTSLETWPSPSPWSRTGCAAGLQREAAAATSARSRRTPFSALATSPPDKVRHSSKGRREIGALCLHFDALCPRADTPVGYSGDIPGDIPRGHTPAANIPGADIQRALRQALSVKLARLVDMGQHREALLQGCILGHAHLRTQIVASTFDCGACTTLNLGVTHERCRLIGLARQVPINPGIAVLSFFRTRSREDDAI